MNAVSLNNLWNYLQELSLTRSNQRWLGEKLIEASSLRTDAGEDSMAGHQRRTHKRRKALSDKQLAECLAAYAPLTDSDFPELNGADYANHTKSSHGRIAKGLEKWL